MRAGAVTVGGVVALATWAATPAFSEPPSPQFTVIASGLNNPRHLTFSPSGSLYVAESGTGGDGPCITSPEGGQACSGPTGSITKIMQTRTSGGSAAWTQDRVVTGLPSLASPVDDPEVGAMKGGSAIGPSDIDVSRGQRYVISIGLGAAPSVREAGQAVAGPGSDTPATLPTGFGTLIQRVPGSSDTRHGQQSSSLPRGWNVMADIAAHEAATNPVDTADSNPASVVRQGSHYLVADAGGNTVLSVDTKGGVRTIAAFQDTMVQAPGAPAGTLMPMQFVPTSIVVGPDGAYYVSQLTGFPFPEGGAAIWRVVPGQAPTMYATGLTNVTDLAFAPDGTLYAVEISAAGLASGGPPIGALVRIAAGGGTPQTVVGGLFAPYGVALRGHDAYVTTGSVLPGGGQVVQIPLG
jgi:hypothetical protein